MSQTRNILELPLEQWPTNWDSILSALNNNEAKNDRNFWKNIVTKYVTSIPLKENTEADYKAFFQQFITHTLPALNNHADVIIQAAERGYDSYIKNRLEALSPNECKLLLQRTTPLMDTALHVACKKGYEMVAKELLTKGANPNAEESFGMTPLHYACQNNSVNVVKLLLAHGANCEVGRFDSEKPIHLAAEANATQAVAALVDHDENQLFTLGGGGRTALFTAVIYNRVEVMETLLAKGGDVNDINPETQESLLHIAAYNNKPNMVMLLLRHKADTNVHNAKNLTPLEYCMRQRTPALESAKIIKDYIQNHSPPIKLR